MVMSNYKIYKIVPISNYEIYIMPMSNCEVDINVIMSNYKVYIIV